MQLTITNKDLATFYSALQKMEIRPMRPNRGRIKLLARLEEKFREYVKDEFELIKDYVEFDKHGQPIVTEDNSYTVKDESQTEELSKLLAELADDEVMIKGGEYSKRYIDFLEYLSEAEGDFTIEELRVIDDVLEQYEVSKEQKEG
ncbi:hypothetical protein Javan290_0010 [Streptococcus phage Javan290]|uniref:DUF1617 family protein n=1 Tax=Streptococcus marmotae TaxID=1825069 RepID=UPI00083176A8|nr:DUF1617 family protein [Streptococcus marmotae]QBX16935.1 hypothetical protein Javan291_0059 [Streptococcus phage Javan291]QBX26064.1 hypothetical protein Javan290_0010 [Streptococcus phage Javan290]